MTTQWTVEGSPEALRIFCMTGDLCFPVLALSFPVARVHPTNEANPVLPVGSGLCATVKSLEAMYYDARSDYDARKFFFWHVTLSHPMEARVTSSIWGNNDLCYSCHSYLNKYDHSVQIKVKEFSTNMCCSLCNC